jgi:hypothetical protein
MATLLAGPENLSRFYWQSPRQFAVRAGKSIHGSIPQQRIEPKKSTQSFFSRFFIPNARISCPCKLSLARGGNESNSGYKRVKCRQSSRNPFKNRSKSSLFEVLGKLRHRTLLT